MLISNQIDFLFLHQKFMVDINTVNAMRGVAFK